MKGLLIGIIIFAAVIGAVFYMQNANAPTTTDNQNQDKEAMTNEEMKDDGLMMEDAGDGVIEDGSMSDQVTLYTLTDVATHNTKDDCWLAIHGKVYDVTEFIPTHPGGPAIIQGCGKDATSMFESRPSSGTSHSETARALLPGFYIGDLATQ